MIRQKRRIAYLVLIMVALVVAISFFSSYFMYHTSLNEQRARLSDIVQIQKNVISEIGIRSWKSHTFDEKGVVDLLVRSHSLFMKERATIEFTVAEEAGESIKFLIVNGQKVQQESPMYAVSKSAGLVEPMKRALKRETGTIIGKDYSNIEVLAAYTYVSMDSINLGLVAKVDINDLKAPFIRANLIILGVGAFLTLLCVWLFFKVSDPIVLELQRSEQQFRGLVESADSLIIQVDAEAKVTYANNSANVYANEDGESIVGIRIGELFEEEVDLTRALNVAEYLHGRTSLKPTPFVRAGGDTGWVAWTSKLFEYESPELLCIGTDVTNEHIAREARRELQERFRALAKAAPVAILITDLKGNLMYANEMMHTLTGASTALLAGTGWLQSVEAQIREELQDSWFNRNNTSTRYEFKLSQVEGGKLWVLGQIVDLENVEGDTVGKLITLTDVTRLKEANIARSRLTAAIEQAAEMIIITDLKGEITYVNPAFEEVTGYSKGEATGQNPRILNSGEQDRAFYKELWNKLTLGEAWNGRFINIRKNGERYTQESTIGPIKNEEGVHIGYVGVARDISEQLFIESRLRQSQKLESIGELAAGIAHEINTPTQYVASNLQFFQDSFDFYKKNVERCEQLVDFVKNNTFAEHDNEIQKLAQEALESQEIEYLNEDLPNALDESESGLKRISEIVQSIKQLAHPGEVSKSFWNLNEIIRDAVNVSTNEWKYTAIIDYNLASDLPEVFSLKAEIGQVVLNIVVNAAHAIDSVREQDDPLGEIGLKTYADGQYAVLEISDSGSGIPEDKLERIFDPFFTTKEVGKGTGQGLAIAHNVVTNMHSGSIEVTSVLGEGSTFIIRLPFEEA